MTNWLKYMFYYWFKGIIIQTFIYNGEEEWERLVGTSWGKISIKRASAHLLEITIRDPNKEVLVKDWIDSHEKRVHPHYPAIREKRHYYPFTDGKVEVGLTIGKVVIDMHNRNITKLAVTITAPR